MRKAIIVYVGILMGMLFMFGSLVHAGTVLYSIDPNGDQAPADIRDLGLSFKYNQSDIITPTILVTADGSLGFANYMTATQQAVEPPYSYVLVFHPQAEDPADQFVKAIPVGRNPALMFFNPTQTEIWVVNLGAYGTRVNLENTISIIDLGTLEVKAVIELPDSTFGIGSNIAFAPGGARAYVASTFSDEILSIDTDTYTVAERLKLLPVSDPFSAPPVPAVGPAWLTISHDGTMLCVTNSFENTVSVVDLDSFTELHRVIIGRAGDIHTANLTFRNNVVFTDDDATALVASVGNNSGTGVLVPDRVYLFDPHTGEKLTDSNGNDIFMMVDDDPSQIRFDPTGQYLIVQITSYNQVDINPYQGFFPAMSIFTWPDRQLYKTLQFRSPTYNMSRTSGFDFMDNGEGSYDILFPSFSTFGYISEQAPHEGIVRVPMGLHESCTSVLTYGDATQREIPAAIVPIPGTDEHVVANFETGVLTVITPPEKYDYSTAMSVSIEDGHFSSAALINLKDQAQEFQMQSFQTNDSIDTNDDIDAGVPFYFVNADGNGEIIPPADVTLAPGQLLVRMYQQLLPEYDQVAGQHGFLKAVSPDQNLQGLVFNGVTSDDGRIIRGDYLKIGQEMYQDSIFPFTQASGSVDTVIHYVNPYLNQTSMVRFLLSPSGDTTENTTLTIGEANGRDEHLSGVPFQGYIRVFNQNNLDNYVYMTVEGTDDDGSFMFACPPLNPGLPSSSQAFHLPYYAVGSGYDTSVILISTNQRTDPEQVDENGDPIVLTTHVKMDFYDLQGNYLTTREMDIDNQSRYELYLSMPEALDHSRFATDILTGSVVITVDRDNVCGALTYTQWAQFDNPDDPDNPISKVQNMAVDKLPLTQDAKNQVVFPYTIGIAPYATSYALYNPGTEPVSVHIEVYNPDGELVGQSEEDQIIPALGDLVYFLGDPAIFGSGFPLEGFVGYMKVTSTSGGAFLGESIQSSPDMLAIIPTF